MNEEYDLFLEMLNTFFTPDKGEFSEILENMKTNSKDGIVHISLDDEGKMIQTNTKDEK